MVSWSCCLQTYSEAVYCVRNSWERQLITLRQPASKERREGEGLPRPFEVISLIISLPSSSQGAVSPKSSSNSQRHHRLGPNIKPAVFGDISELNQSTNYKTDSYFFLHFKVFPLLFFSGLLYFTWLFLDCVFFLFYF